MISAPPAPRAIVFDWDNTLVDTWPTIHEALTITLAAMGHRPWSLEQTRARVRNSLRDSFPALFGERWREARDVFYDAFERVHIAALKPSAGAGDLLQALRDAGIYVAVVSNKTGHYLRREVEHLGWHRLIASIVGAGDAERDKPAPEALTLALRDAPSAAGPEVWFVGDSGIDMEIAHRTGCVPVLVNRSDTDAAEFAKWPPLHVFSGCNAVSALVERWRT